jgi:hypothetical protein
VESVSRMYPASYELPHIVSVAASDHHDEYASHTWCEKGGTPEWRCLFSSWGVESVDLAAPGSDVVSTVRMRATRPWTARRCEPTRRRGGGPGQVASSRLERARDQERHHQLGRPSPRAREARRLSRRPCAGALHPHQRQAQRALRARRRHATRGGAAGPRVGTPDCSPGARGSRRSGRSKAAATRFWSPGAIWTAASSSGGRIAARPERTSS